MCASDRFAHLQHGLVVPLAAVEAALAIERAGHRLTIDGPDLLVEKAGALDPHDLEQLRRWKEHVKLLLTHVASDRHLQDNQQQGAQEFGPIVVTRGQA